MMRSNHISATIRLQFNQNFTFDHANSLVDYYSKLGITHIYASPILTARENSTHGYDIVNPTQINSNLGGIDGLRRLVKTLRNHHMGLIIDIVPNHMGVGGHENPWWQHVLEWGRKSPYAFWFDIDWDSADVHLNNKILAPFLGDPYGTSLENGDIKLKFNPTEGRIEAHYFSHCFPISLSIYKEILSHNHSQSFEKIISELAEIDFELDFLIIENDVEKVFQQLKSLCASETGLLTLTEILDLYNGDSKEAKSRLHDLLERQHYRLTWWRNATDQINWRRFFEISELAGIRVELDEVFEATHSLIFDLYKEGLIDGLRIDHIDGLAYPQQYCTKLRSRLQKLSNHRPPDLQQEPYLIAEKILAHNEFLVTDWQLEGTTGYDFMEDVNALLHDANGEEPLTLLWEKITQDKNDFNQNIHNARRQLLRENFVAEFEATAMALHKIARVDLNTRDYSLASIKRVLTEILVHLPVYRTYIVASEKPSIFDQSIFDGIAINALRTLSNVDKPLLNIVLSWLIGDQVQSGDNSLFADLSRRAISRFQQLTPALVAKSVEDTAFYRYGRLLSRNEVGGSPEIFSISIEEFHQRCLTRQKNYPLGMLATATHDNKRGEDARARLAVLSEIPLQWQQTVCHWFQLNAAYRQDIQPNNNLDALYIAPRPHHEYMLYQTLVGHWPYDLSIDDADALEQYAIRLNAWFLKSIREAKRFSNWIQVNEEYETACTTFIFNILKLENQQFIKEVSAFVRRISSAGIINSLSMCLLRLTCPGVPDLYQGTELWDFNLVDPDNRREVNYEFRQQVINEDFELKVRLKNWEDGSIKLGLIKEVLNLKKAKPSLFNKGDYTPLKLTGSKSEHFISFARNFKSESVIVIAPRILTRILSGHNNPSLILEENELILTLETGIESLYDIFTKRNFKISNGKLDLSKILKDLPFSVLLYLR
ncbi:MAG: malto-oligosyltrehalose synthase [Methylotenera sp.]|uniref:malto-oligosyltrehalose synthase n=1 Tax=Methylotenera sp. TaxID=2051956 RepID=UPI00248A589B|nr:malto-oligosyltrehalose synthase [Methylotenera sp.]MDI1308852.1 malto-oligosyltrehalose synthase [Methylotenera sp.]